MALKLHPGARLVAATHNPGKARELAELLDGRFDLVAAGALGLAEPEETETSFAGNALLKARHAADASGLVALADDSGLSVRALDGAPGVYSARYAGEGATDAANNAKLLAALAALGDAPAGMPEAPAGARLLSPASFVCALVLYDPRTSERTEAEGAVRGFIADRASGSGGFGYDPLFYLPEFGRTMAEITLEQKNAISHRGQALRELLAKLK